MYSKETLRKMSGKMLLSCYDTAQHLATSRTTNETVKGVQEIRAEVIRRLDLLEKLYGVMKA